MANFPGKNARMFVMSSAEFEQAERMIAVLRSLGLLSEAREVAEWLLGKDEPTEPKV